MKSSISRRRLLTLAGMIAGATTIQANVARAGDPIGSRPSVNGVITQLRPESLTLETLSGPVAVSFEPGATFFRDNHAVTLSDYKVGDHVLAVGRSALARVTPRTAHFLSFHMESRFGIIDDAVIVTVGDGQLVTDKGRVVWPAPNCLIHAEGVRDPLPYTVLTPGTEVAVATLFEPEFNQRVARDITVYA